MDKNFFALEGQDGSGKTIQLDLLEEKLIANSYKVKVVDLPQYKKPSAQWVSAYLRGEYGPTQKVSPYLASIFYAFDRFNAGLEVKGWLDEGNVVLANRWVASNLAHQGTKVSPRELQNFFDWLIDLEYRVFNLPEPLTIILHVPAALSFRLVEERAKQLGKKRDGHEVDFDHLRKAEEIYLKMAKLWPEENKLVECCKSDHLLSPEEIHEKIWAVVKQKLA